MPKPIVPDIKLAIFMLLLFVYVVYLLLRKDK